MTDKKQLAFGVDSRRCEKYSLRQSRYYVISRDVSRIVSEIKSKNQRVKLLYQLQ